MSLYKDRRSPLWVAAERGHDKLALLLITAGCKVTQEHWIGLGDFPGACQGNADLKEVRLSKLQYLSTKVTSLVI